MAFDACMMRAVLGEFVRDFPEAKIEKILLVKKYFNAKCPSQFETVAGIFC